MSTSLSCGLVGLPNVGKSTIFNAILSCCNAVAANFPFCTIEPNVGHAPIRDPRLNILHELSGSEKIVPALLQCVDIAGMIRNAHKGEGLGNQFLGHIRECDLIIHVVRCFEDESIIHVEGNVDPLRDYEIITLELQFSDLEKLEVILSKKNTSDSLRALAERAKKHLSGTYMLGQNWTPDELHLFSQNGLLTHKPMLVVANMKSANDAHQLEKIKHLNPVPIFAELETFLQSADESERAEMMNEFGLKSNSLDDVLREAYRMLNLLTFFTVGKKETRAWKVNNGATMQDAAGVIHSDFYKSFISAEVVKYSDFVAANGWTGSREQGLAKTCAKTALVSDGDICLFKTYC